MHELSSYPKFQSGRQALRDGKLEEAIDDFAALVQELNEKHGEDSLEVAPAWFEYGNALLQKEEENPSYGLLGNAAQKAVEEKEKKEAAASENKEDEESTEKSPKGEKGVVEEEGDEEEEEEEMEEEEEEDEEEEAESKGDALKIGGNTSTANDAASTEAGAVDPSSEDADDLQIAFECLETARRLYEKFPSESSDARLAEIRIRIGDLKRFNNDESGAIEEYKKALDIREVICEPHERDLSEVHFNLAQAYVYLGKGDENDPLTALPGSDSNVGSSSSSAPTSNAPLDAITARKTALCHYEKCHAALELFLVKAEGVTMEHIKDPKCMCSKCVADVSELEKELKETVDAMKDEIQSETASGNNGATSSSSAGVTTIGFGSASNNVGTSSTTDKSSSSAAVPAFNFGSAPTSFNFTSNSSSSFPSSFPGKDVTNLGKREGEAVTNIMQVKKKVKATAVTPLAATISDKDLEAESKENPTTSLSTVV